MRIFIFGILFLNIMHSYASSSEYKTLLAQQNSEYESKEAECDREWEKNERWWGPSILFESDLIAWEDIYAPLGAMREKHENERKNFVSEEHKKEQEILALKKQVHLLAQQVQQLSLSKQYNKK